jgi:hypothetical protein
MLAVIAIRYVRATCDCVKPAPGSEANTARSLFPVETGSGR